MAGTAITLPPQFITKDNHGGYIVITAALLMTWSVLFWIIRAVVRFGYNNYIAADDVTATIGTVLGCAQAIVVILAVTTAGLGRRIGSLGLESLHRTEVLVYSSDLLFPIVLACAKIATSELIARLTRQSGHLVACRILTIITSLWALVSVLTIGVGCHPSHAWDMVDRCSNLQTVWFAIGAIDIVTELCLVLLPAVLVWPLQMPRGSKAIVLFAFGSRLPLVAVIILRLVYLTRTRHSIDYTFDLTLPAIFNQVELHYGLFSMTIPCLRPFLKAFDTGTLATYAAQIEVGMGAPPNAESATIELSQRSSRRWDSRRTSSLLLDPQRVSVYTIVENTGKSAPIYPARLAITDEHPELGTVALPAVTRIRHSDDGTISDDDSVRHIIRKTGKSDVRYSPDGWQ